MQNGDFSLVLSGGAALGCAHLGVLEALAARDLRPREVLGASMGAIVGAAYAFGYSTEEIARSLAEFSALTKWVKPSWTQPAFFHTEKIAEVFHSLFADRTLRDAEHPLKIVATDFTSGRARVFDQRDDTPVRDALLASMSIPVLFPPVPLDGETYVDGFLSANLPVAFAAPDLPVLAVDVMSVRSLPGLESGLGSGLGSGRNPVQKPKALVQAYERTFCLLVHSQTRAALAQRGDVTLIEPPLAGYHVYDFAAWDAIRRIGFDEAQRMLGD